MTALGDSLWAPVRPASVALRDIIASSMPTPHHSHKWLDGVSDALAYALHRLRDLRPLRQLRPYARAYTYRGLRAFASLSMARSGCVGDVHVDTRSRHEKMLLRDYDQSEQAMTRHKGALWLVDRAFIDAPFWDKKKKRLGITMITRMKSSLCVDSTEGLAVADLPVNEGVVKEKIPAVLPRLRELKSGN